MTLQRLYCLFVMEVGSRHIYGTSWGSPLTPDGLWTVQQIRNLSTSLG